MNHPPEKPATPPVVPQISRASNDPVPLGPPHAEPAGRLRRGLGWWGLWLFTLLVSLLPPVVHHLRGVADIIEPFRYRWGLLPSDLLFLRHFGELSRWVPVVLLGAGVLAARKPGLKKPVIACGACLVAGFSSLYTAYCLLIVTTYLQSYTTVMEDKGDLIRSVYPTRTKVSVKSGDPVPTTVRPPR